MAQEAKINVHSQSELLSRGDALMQRALASPTGEPGEKLDHHGSHWLLLMARARTGESELHQLWADEIVVRARELTLVVGGNMLDQHPYKTFQESSMEAAYAVVPHMSFTRET